mmetsp:Transcript_9714/g.21799  ORF Transcript_9714/g.21799 Transcript_9714/m.21799 type:complete len:317 (+) Transcript_9714:1629-2579(+)
MPGQAERFRQIRPPPRALQIAPTPRSVSRSKRFSSRLVRQACKGLPCSSSNSASLILRQPAICRCSRAGADLNSARKPFFVTLSQPLTSKRLRWQPCASATKAESSTRRAWGMSSSRSAVQWAPTSRSARSPNSPTLVQPVRSSTLRERPCPCAMRHRPLSVMRSHSRRKTFSSLQAPPAITVRDMSSTLGQRERSRVTILEHRRANERTPTLVRFKHPCRFSLWRCTRCLAMAHTPTSETALHEVRSRLLICGCTVHSSCTVMFVTTSPDSNPYCRRSMSSISLPVSSLQKFTIMTCMFMSCSAVSCLSAMMREM